MKFADYVSYGERFHKLDHILIESDFTEIFGGDLVLSKVLLMGYPRIPLSEFSILVAAEGEISAVVDKYRCSHHQYVISSMARGGFSGSPVISEKGTLLGIVTETLIENGKEIELGFLTALTIEPLLELLLSNQIYPGKNMNVLKQYQESIHCFPDEEIPF